jgi:uncharacterized cupredoxin-like copper-binding protein
MRQRLPLVLSATALVVSVLGSTSLGQAAGKVLVRTLNSSTSSGLRFTVVTAEATGTSASVHCPKGDVATGGGAYSSGSPLTADIPLLRDELHRIQRPATGWQAASATGGIIVAVICVSALPATAPPATSTGTATTPTTTTAPATTTAPSTVTVTANHAYSFSLSSETVSTGAVTFTVTNPETSIPSHDFEVCLNPLTASEIKKPALELPNKCAGTSTPPSTPVLAPGAASATLTVDFTTPGTYEYLSSVPGDALAGMKGKLTVGMPVPSP